MSGVQRRPSLNQDITTNWMKEPRGSWEERIPNGIQKLWRSWLGLQGPEARLKPHGKSVERLEDFSPQKRSPSGAKASLSLPPHDSNAEFHCVGHDRTDLIICVDWQLRSPLTVLWRGGSEWPPWLEYRGIPLYTTNNVQKENLLRCSVWQLIESIFRCASSLAVSISMVWC